MTMVELIPRNKCTGCAACAQACPKECIRMQPDAEGFLRPTYNEADCIDCGVCRRVCPVLHPKVRTETPTAYAARCTDEMIRSASSSGGVFTLLAEVVLEQGGVVFGAGFDDKFRVVHTLVRRKEELAKMRGSKYVQSDVGDTYRKAKELLDSGGLVYYSGTPCQIQGLLSYLQKPYERLITQDIICHGVPSPWVWEKYLEDQKQRLKSTVKEISFRDKTSGWRRYSIRISMENGKVYKEVNANDLYMRSFTKDMCLRLSCYECAFKTIQRVSDLTLADFWGVEYVHPEMDDDRGISLVMVNSCKGAELFDRATDGLLYKPTDLMEAIKYNGAVIRSTERPKCRDEFMELFRQKGFRSAAIKFCARPNLLQRILRKFRRVLFRR